MVLAAFDLLQRNANPSRDEIRVAIAGNLCRCTGYEKILDSVAEAASHLRSAS
jgi:aerobic-type carbon monoxide dehydrogenase small subunit (CoxS/CutS family)